MRNILFVAFLLIFVGCVFSQFPNGAQVFYMNVLHTNKAYGSGAAFPADVWFNGNLGLMRIDYKTPGTNNVFVSVLYNYTSHDKYEVCGTKCSRATWNSPAPIFFGSSSTYKNPTSGVTPDWPGPAACPANTLTYVSQPAQPLGLKSLSYTETSGTGKNLCLVRWSVQFGQTYGVEWHVQTYSTTTYPSGNNPASASTYSSVINGKGCPEPTCITVLDLAVIVDESGSIWDAGAWGDVQNFVLQLISTFDMGPDKVRVGLSYFSGLDNCKYNWTGSKSNYVSACDDGTKDGNCNICGGRWDTLTSGLYTSKSSVIKLAYDHNIAKGFTCISCGLDVGIKLLNVAPKANVQKLIILFTDGAQNRVTNKLKYEGDLAKSMGINVIAVATGGYKLGDLQVFADDSNIFTSSTFSGLTSLINSIVSPLCQPLGSIDTCDFCSGLCSCQTTCTCPDCNDYNACTNQRCDIRPPPDGTLGVCTYTNLDCDDHNVCTQNLCVPATGCSFPPVPAPTGPPVNNYCKKWICNDPEGYKFNDVGTGLCPQGSDLCIVNYCNSTFGSTGGLTGSCVTQDLNQIPYGQTYTYTTSGGQTFNRQGCKKPTSGVPSCYVYKCNPVDGSCGIDKSSCKCLTDADCNTDQNGCTVDVCDLVNNVCKRTTHDCWSDLSQGQCVTGTPGSASTATGDAYWSGTMTFNFNGNLPVVQSYTCDQLACFAGQRSTYSCVSQSPTTYTCSRSTANCTSTGCTDNVCQTTGTWASGQYTTNCGNQKTRTCADTNKCTSDNCKTSFSGVGCTMASCPTDSTRCTFTDISSTCDDHNACTVNRCLPASGCDYSQNIVLSPDTTCYHYTCNPASGQVRNVIANACPPFGGNKCNITYCNTTTSSCQAGWDKATHTTAESTVFIDEYGNLQQYFGCLNTSALPVTCLSAKCNTATGACFIDSAGCACVNDDSKCDDGNGCTIDKCDPGTGSCIYSDVDCWKQLSNGGCTLNSGGSQDTTVGQANYDLGSPINPAPDGTVSRNCAEMACFSGQRYKYVCQSTGSNSHQCNAFASSCPKGGCLDTICRTLGTWNNLQYDNDCGTTVVPACTSTGCKIRSCNTSFVYVNGAAPGGNGNAPNIGDNRCNVVDNSTSCVDGLVCTLDGVCNDAQSGPMGGCDFSQTIPNPFTVNGCFTYECVNAQGGWVKTPISCGTTNLCQVKYCNTTLNAGECINPAIDRTTLAVGTTVFYVDSDGLTKSAVGCANPIPNDPLTCKKYDCDAATGLCTLDISTCQCLTDQQCEDGSGCTVDKCVATGCSRTYIDCFSLSSNGGCTINKTPITSTAATGLAIYYNVYLPNASPASYDYLTKYDPVTGLPSDLTKTRTCEQLACYNGQPSNYTCSSTAETNYQCSRVFVSCSRNGCKDNICQSALWNSNNQINSNCDYVVSQQCADNNACTSDYCDITWTPQSPPNKPRCRHDTLNGTNFCDDGNFCTFDYCDQLDTSGNVCKHSLYSNQYLRKYICKNRKICQTVSCTVNKCVYSYIGCTAPSLCIYFVCNGSTNDTCKAYPTGVYKLDGCGVCAGNGLSCLPTTPGSPKKTSIAVALGVGLGVGLFFAFVIIGIITRTSYAAYLSLGTETLGSVTTSPVHQHGEHHLDTGDYNHHHHN